MPHDWLCAVAQQHASYYEEVEVDHRAQNPFLKALKKRIRLLRKVLPGCLGWKRFVETWKPCHLILTSRLKVRDRAQKLPFKRHEEYFPDTSVPLLYRPEDKRRHGHGHHPRALTGGQAKSAGACPERRYRGALEICPRGPRRQVGLGLGTCLCNHSPLEPRSHYCRPAKGLDH